MPANVEDLRRPKRYVVFGGYVMCGDGQKRFVSPMQVIKCYNVNPEDCVLGDPEEMQMVSGLQHMRGMHKDLIQLWPQSNPNEYKKLPEK
jgi:hypothetical protein